MLPLAFALLAPPAGPSLAEIDQIARSRNVDAFTKLVTPDSLQPENPLRVLKSNGTYGVGRFGWKAEEMAAPGGPNYVVLTTPLTSQDVGELLFKRVGDNLRYVSEKNDFFVYPIGHSMEVTIDKDAKTVSFKDKVDFYAHGPTLPHFMIRMSPYLKVSSVKDSQGKAVPFAQAGGITAIARPAKIRAFSYTIEYAGRPTLARYAGSFGEKEMQLTNDYWYPMIARKPTPFLLVVKGPPEWTVIAQGKDLPSGVQNGVRYSRFRMEKPIAYWSLSAGEYKSHFEKVGRVQLGVWSTEMSEQDMKLQAQLYGPVFKLFSQKFGDYPFPRFGALVSPLYGSGALEAYSYATYGTGWLPDEDAHEPSHTWFGGLVNNTYLNSLWNEAFASWAEDYYQREVPIGNVAERRRAFISDAKPDSSWELATCANSPPWIGPVASELGYGKGAKVLQMLEIELGTPLFEKCVRAFVQRYSNGQPADWEDFERVVDVTSQRSMKPFFDQWLRRTGWPKFDVKDVKWSSGLLGGKVVFQGKPYDINLEGFAVYEDGSYGNFTVQTMQIPATDGYFFRVKMPKKPRLVSLDPWRRIIRDVSPNEEPRSIRSLARNGPRYTDPKTPDYLKGLGGELKTELPKDINDVFIVGHPDTLPIMKELCEKAGFKVTGNKLVYRETEIDLTKGAALAIVDLGSGRQCLIGLGKTRLRPNYGRARVAIFDEYGRFLRGYTEPKTSGKLTFKNF